MTVRLIESNDWEFLTRWWKEWEWPPLHPSIMPKTGYLVEKDGEPIAATWVYYSIDTTIAFMEWTISNKNYRGDDRDEAITLLLETAQNITKQDGYSAIFTIGRSDKLNKKFMDLGWISDGKKSLELTKIL